MNMFISSIYYGVSNYLYGQTYLNALKPVVEDLTDVWEEVSTNTKENLLSMSMILATPTNQKTEVTAEKAYELTIATLSETLEKSILAPIENGQAESYLKNLEKTGQPMMLVAARLLKNLSEMELQCSNLGVLNEKQVKVLQNFQKQVTMMTGMDIHKPMYVLCNLALQIRKMTDLDNHMKGIVMDVNNKNEIQLGIFPKANHGEVSIQLVKLVKDIKTGDILNQCTNNMLFEMTYASLYLFSNYSQLMTTSSHLDGLLPIVKNLQEFIELLRAELENRENAKCPLSGAIIANVCESLEAIGYANMDDSKDNFARLSKLDQVIGLVNCVACENSANITDFGFVQHNLEEKFEKELSLFQSQDKKTVVIAFKGDDSFITLKNPYVATERADGNIDGTMLSCVKHCAKKKSEILETLKTRKREVLAQAETIIIAGFGVDGAAAEFVSAQMKKSEFYKKKEFMAVGVGSPDYLSLNGVMDLKEIQNFNSYSFKWSGDTAINFNTYISSAMGNRELRPAGVIIPIQCSDVYFSDKIQGGHVKSIYSKDLAKALGRAKLTYGQVAKLNEDIKNRGTNINSNNTITNNTNNKITEK